MRIVVGTCPHCGGRSLAEWLDDDMICVACGAVVYSRVAVLPAPHKIRNEHKALTCPAPARGRSLEESSQ
jgi:hypothetical protein